MLALLLGLTLAQVVPSEGVLPRPANSVPYCWRGKTLLTEGGPCDDADLTWMLRAAGAPTAEALAAEGMSGIRVSSYDGFTNMEPMVTYGTGPTGGYIEARSVGRDGVVATQRAPASDTVASAVARLIERSTTEPAPLPPIPPGAPPFALCTDEPVVIVEVITDGRVVRQRPRMCDGRPASPYWTKLTELATDAFTQCAGLLPEKYSWPTHRLDLCLLAGGDRPDLALELIDNLRLLIANQTSRPFAPEALADDVVLVRAGGDRLLGRNVVSSALMARPGDMLQVSRVSGDDQGVTVWAGPAGMPRAVRLRWAKFPDGRWRIVEWRQNRD